MLCTTFRESDNKEKCEYVSHTIKKIVDSGIELAIVIGAGNFWRGRTGTEISRVKSDQMGMLSTSINAICLSDSFLYFKQNSG